MWGKETKKSGKGEHNKDLKIDALGKVTEIWDETEE